MRPRALLVGLVLVTIALVLVAAGCGGSGGGGSADEPATESDGLSQNTPGEGDELAPTAEGTGDDVDPVVAAERAELLAGIPQQDRVLGDAGAPVTLIAYEDFLCTFCGRFSKEMLPGVLDEHVRPGNVKIEYRPVAFYGEVSRQGALAALAAGQQNRLWDYVETTFGQQADATDYLTPEFLERTADDVGLDAPRWEAARRAPATADEFDELQLTAELDGVGGTPTFVVEGPGGQQAIPGLPAPEALDELLTAAQG
jgi:protein-disulfide isomerase